MLKAINTTTIQVTFNKDPKPADLAVANFSLSKGTVESVTASGKVATITVAGLSYGDSTTVTVGSPAHTELVKVPAINELFDLVITSDAKDNNNTIKSDGASATMLTAQIIEKATGEAVVKDAQVQFTTTLGSLSQPQVALVNGSASTQLRSISSPTSQTAIVNATVASAPGAKEYVGLTGALVVNFTPDGKGTGTTTMVSAVSAGADQGDRFFVKFSGKVSAEDYKKVVTAKGANAWAGATYGIQYKGAGGNYHNLKIVDAYNVTEDTLMFVLDTDFKGSIAPGVGTGPENFEMIDANFTGDVDSEGNFLRDNVNHTIRINNNITDLVVNSSDLTFMASDVTKPFIYGVDAKDAKGEDSNITITVRASEALAQGLTETSALNETNENITIDGKKLRLINPATVTTADVTTAKDNNEILVTSLYVGEYDATKSPAVDNRSNIYITLHKDFKLTAGSHGIQISKIGDLAGHTDSPANTVTTQTFPLTVKADTAVPAATVVAQSPEQWLITFDRPVDTVTGKNISDALKIYTKEGYAASTKVPLKMNATTDANDYIVTVIDENGVATSAGQLATTATLSGVKHLLVEFNRDWSVALKGSANDKDNYWKSGLNPFKVVLDNVESATGVKMAESVKDVSISYDGQSPEIKNAVDLFEKAPKAEFRGITALENNASGKYVYVEMDEPVQLVNADGTAISKPVTPNLEQNSAGAAYGNTAGVPRSTFRFVKGDKVVLGDPIELAADDQSFVVKPRTDLEAGTWTLYIEQISDDHGNTSATISKKVTVAESAAAVTDTKVAWAAFDNNASNGTHDYLYVKFTKEMKAYTANGVDATTNYKFRGYDLPEGSDISVGIDGVTDAWDGVTIKMPKGAWDGIGGATAFTTNMSIASNFEAADGTKLSSNQPVQFELTHSTGISAADNDGLTGSGKFEALYVNADKATLVGGAAVINTTALDSDSDGDIDEIEVMTASPATVKATDYILVNGKKFVAGTDQTGTTLTFKADNPTATGSVGTNEIAGTSIKGLKVTTANGSLLINPDKVIDKAAPVITSAELNAGKDKITLTFSEAVTAKNDGTFGSLVNGDFTFAGGTTAAVTGVEHNAASPNKVVLTISGGNSLVTTNTITADGAFDFAKNASTEPFSPIKGSLTVEDFFATQKVANVAATDVPGDGLSNGQNNDGKIKVTWNPLTYATGYTVKVYDSSNDLVQTIPNATSGLVVDGLNGGDTYTVTVTGHYNTTASLESDAGTVNVVNQVLIGASNHNFATSNTYLGGLADQIKIVYSDALETTPLTLTINTSAATNRSDLPAIINAAITGSVLEGLIQPVTYTAMRADGKEHVISFSTVKGGTDVTFARYDKDDELLYESTGSATN
ncbi:hypothetical protein ORD22_08130 [Sporosarcina sp. GW1-11]|uniref:hypothetical protein n=1 Tax=Sporosarcina sp. GW1-11 TaxID=2899126 RepID=UPI00294C69D6|nr:hypothetical protein [Sporosarcina sp. GW1-11]MDV6378214.1 hypothetical protein [Sporosarcina sp. GW1-11]